MNQNAKTTFFTAQHAPGSEESSLNLEHRPQSEAPDTESSTPYWKPVLGVLQAPQAQHV